LFLIWDENYHSVEEYSVPPLSLKNMPEDNEEELDSQRLCWETICGNKDSTDLPTPGIGFVDWI